MSQRERKDQAPDEPTCATCPAWCKSLNDEGSEQLIPRFGRDGQPVIVDGKQQFATGAHGRFIVAGACRLRAPVVMLEPRGVTTNFPATRSDWWCGEHPQRRG
jgi:hypothetical protein